MFERIKKFWTVFLDSIKKAYDAVFARSDAGADVQLYEDTSRVNLLSIFVGKLANLVNVEATFDIESDSSVADPLRALCKDLEGRRYDIVSGVLAEGDYFVFPATNDKGEIVHSGIPQSRVRIAEMDGENITDAYVILDWVQLKNGDVHFLLRHHALDSNGTLLISYTVVNDDGRHVSDSRWADLDGVAYQVTGANHIGFGRYRSPVSDRGLSPVYGVPLNFGCGEIEKKIFHDLEMIDREFKNGESKIFTDPRNLVPDETKKQYKFADNIIPIRSNAGAVGPNIDIFSPALRFSDHYSKLVSDLALYEKQVGTSKGILTENETAWTSTATAVKRSNADTIALVDRIRSAVDAGNEMTLKADAVFIGISNDLWSYRSDWYDPFEDPSEQFDRLNAAISGGYAEKSDGVRWLFPDLSDEEVEEKLERIASAAAGDTEAALNRILGQA